MTHSSEWQIAISGTRKRVLKLEQFLKKALDDVDRPLGERTAISIILGNKTMVAENKKSQERALAFGQSKTNCDTHWDNVISELIALGRDKLKIKISYARLGEEMDDYEFDDMEGLRLYYSRYLMEVEL